MNVTVIIAVYNYEKYLKQSIESALNFDIVDEILLIEDASTDGSLLICKKLSQQHKNVYLHQHADKKNHGLPACRNLGIRLSKNQFVAFLDADDYYLPNRFDAYLKHGLWASKNLGICEPIGLHQNSNHTVDIIESYSMTSLDIVPKSNQLFETLVLDKHGHFSFDGIILNKEIFILSGYFDEAILIKEDTDMLWRLALTEQLFIPQISTPVANRRIHGKNSILHKDAVKHFKEMFIHKWFGIMLSSNFSTEVNRYLTKAKVAKLISTTEHTKFPLKVIGLIRLILANPTLIFKLI